MQEKMNEENTEEVRVLEAQIERLQAEVAALQDQQQDNQKDITLNLTGQIQEAMCVSLIIQHNFLDLCHPSFSLQTVAFSHLQLYILKSCAELSTVNKQRVFRVHRLYMCGQRQEGETERVLSRLKEEVEELEEDLKRQTQMNGISLNSCTTKTLQSSKSTAKSTASAVF